MNNDTVWAHRKHDGIEEQHVNGLGMSEPEQRGQARLLHVRLKRRGVEYVVDTEQGCAHYVCAQHALAVAQVPAQTAKYPHLSQGLQAAMPLPTCMGLQIAEGDDYVIERTHITGSHNKTAGKTPHQGRLAAMSRRGRVCRALVRAMAAMSTPARPALMLIASRISSTAASPCA